MDARQRAAGSTASAVVWFVSSAYTICILVVCSAGDKGLQAAGDKGLQAVAVKLKTTRTPAQQPCVRLKA
jgi:hypothetical protein